MAETFTPLTTSNLGGSISSITSAVDTNFSTVASQFNDVLSRKGNSPNTMTSNLDMNSQQVINLPYPSSNNSPIRLGDVSNNPLNLIGAPGPTGPVGPAGPRGIQGIAGVSGSLGISVITYGADPTGVADSTTAFTNWINDLQGSNLLGYIPGGIYLIKSNLPTIVKPVTILGAGSFCTWIVIDPSLSGDLFSFSNICITNASFPFNGNTVNIAASITGPSIGGFTIVGQRSSPATQNAFMFYDRCDELYFHDIDVFYLNGRCFSCGFPKNSINAYMRESRLERLRFFNCGNSSSPVMEFNSAGVTGDSTNTCAITDLDIYANYGTGIVVRSNGGLGVSGLYFKRLRVEGIENNPTGVAADLVQIGDTAQVGQIHSLVFDQALIFNTYSNFAGMRITSTSQSLQPYQIAMVNSGITGGSGLGLVINYGRSLYFHLPIGIATTGKNLTVSATNQTGSPIVIDACGNESTFTMAIDVSAVANVLSPTRHQFP